MGLAVKVPIAKVLKVPKITTKALPVCQDGWSLQYEWWNSSRSSVMEMDKMKSLCGCSLRPRRTIMHQQEGNGKKICAAANGKCHL